MIVWANNNGVVDMVNVDKTITGKIEYRLGANIIADPQKYSTNGVSIGDGHGRGM